MKHKAQKIYVSRITVHCSSVAGVIDMMRYDGCVPETEAESNKLQQLMPLAGPPKTREVTFRRYSNNPGGPTEGRWKSFGCTVLSWEPL